jgi:hypothetical protein
VTLEQAVLFEQGIEKQRGDTNGEEKKKEFLLQMRNCSRNKRKLLLKLWKQNIQPAGGG